MVLLTFGAGNLPSVNDAIGEIKNACERGLVIVNISQCVKGPVTSTYVLGKVLICAITEWLCDYLYLVTPPLTRCCTEQELYADMI